MLRTRLLTATAAVALFAAGSAFAQTAPEMTAPETAAPPASQAAPAPAETTVAEQTPAAANTVVDVLRAQGQFTTLLTALDAAQLTDTLASQPAISIFAPTDAAFAALPEADRTRLMDPANVNELRQVLLYHVVVADVESSQIEGAKGGVQTAATTEVQLDGTGDSIKVDNATVTTADIGASNGAVFIIDQVLNPAQSQVAAGDAAEAAMPAQEPVDETAVPTPAPVAPAVEGAPPADEVTPADGLTEPMEGDDMMAPAAPTTTMPSTTTAPGTVNAPNGEPADSVTTTASPPVPNPTDGQVDGEAADDTEDTMTPTPQS